MVLGVAKNIVFDDQVVDPLAGNDREELWDSEAVVCTGL